MFWPCLDYFSMHPFFEFHLIGLYMFFISQSIATVDCVMKNLALQFFSTSLRKDRSVPLRGLSHI